MIILLDTMASRYGRLPSELVLNADTFDVEVMVRSIDWHNKKQSDNNHPQVETRVDDYSAADLEKMLNRKMK